MSNNTQTGSGNTDLLSSIIGIKVRNEENISEQDQDRQFCQQHQDQLNAVLTHLEQWYTLFIANFDKYADVHKLTMNKNGSIKEGYNNRSWGAEYRRFSDFAYLPFNSISKVVELWHAAIEAFGRNIINYFRNIYDINLEKLEVDYENLTWGFRPVYQTYVDHVITHLGGKDFRETAIDELISRFHKVVVSG